MRGGKRSEGGVAMSYIVGINRNQGTVIPEYLDEYVTEENPVRVFDAFVNSLDMQACGFKRSTPAEEGRPGYDPRDLLKLFIYGYFNKLRSSRGLSKETRRNLEVMWLLNKLTPDFRTISDFRKDNAKALKEVFKAFNRLCNELKLFSKEYISIDGSKFKAVNAKDQNFTLSKLDDRLIRLDARIEEYMRPAEEADKSEPDERSFSGAEIAEKIEKLKERQEKYTAYRTELEESGAGQKSLTDSQARLMKISGKNDVGYNVQTAVDSGSHMIVGFEVTNSPTDHGLLEAVASGVKSDFGMNQIEAVADCGYRDGEDMMKCLESGIIPNVYPADGEAYIELETRYEPSEITPEIESGTDAADIKKCLRAGVVPTIYQEIISEISVAERASHEHLDDSEMLAGLSEEEILQKAKEGFFIRDINHNKVYCPQGQILRQQYVQKNGSIRYVNKLACRNCSQKCTKSAFKEVAFAPGQVLAVSLILGSRKIYNERMKQRLAAPKQYQKIVKLKFKPDRRKLAERKCLSEHPFGTVKRALGASYFLLKGIEKVTAESALAFLSYNFIRAMRLIGVPKLLAAMAY